MHQKLLELVNQCQLDESAAQQVNDLLGQGIPLDRALLESGTLSQEQCVENFGAWFDLPTTHLTNYLPDKQLLKKCPARVLLAHNLLPLEIVNGQLRVATAFISNRSGMDELRMATGMTISPVLAPLSAIQRCLKAHLGVGADTVQSLVADKDGIQVIDDQDHDDDVDLADEAGDASIIRLVNQVLSEAIERRATDVHIEPFEEELRVRYRIDGVLQEASLPAEVKRFQAAIVSRLKILSHMDIAEKRVPQDGRIKLKINEREIDVRVSVIPMLYGEAVVLRLLDRSSALLGLEQLGIAKDDQDKLDRILALPHGIVLVTGPTGSGKTTTLYAALSRINDVDRKIITIEDPIEYQLRGINQIQVATRAGMTFAKGLRAILRHDPDVVLIGEIRDSETAQIAVQASLTGHMVFSTLHTNDAPSAITRLIDMQVEPYLVASSLEAVMAQRLVRRICDSCKQPYVPQDRNATELDLGVTLPEKLYHGKGCSNCQNTGYRGRTVICEMMTITAPIRTLILERTSADRIRNAASHQGARNLREDGWRHVQAGTTTVEEVLRVTKDERNDFAKSQPPVPQTES